MLGQVLDVRKPNCPTFKYFHGPPGIVYSFQGLEQFTPHAPRHTPSHLLIIRHALRRSPLAFLCLKHMGTIHLPLMIETDEDGVFIVSCPAFKGCHSYGKTVEEAIVNVREVIAMCMEE